MKTLKENHGIISDQSIWEKGTLTLPHNISDKVVFSLFAMVLVKSLKMTLHKQISLKSQAWIRFFYFGIKTI